MVLTKEQICSANDISRVEVEVPEWGGTVFVKTMTGAERDAYESSLISGRKLNLQDVTAKLCVCCIVDEQGNRLFNEGDIAALSNKSARALSRVYAKAQELNGLRPEDIGELVKNSGSGLSEGSISA